MKWEKIIAHTKTLSTLRLFSIRYPLMYSTAAARSNIHHSTKVKASPRVTHTADSIAASLMVTTCALRWNTRMSTKSNTVMRPSNIGQPHSGTVMSTKFPLELPAAINMSVCVLSLDLSGTGETE